MNPRVKNTQRLERGKIHLEPLPNNSSNQGLQNSWMKGKKKRRVPRHQTLKIILGIASKQRDLVNLLRKMARETKAEKKKLDTLPGYKNQGCTSYGTCTSVS